MVLFLLAKAGGLRSEPWILCLQTQLTNINTQNSWKIGLHIVIRKWISLPHQHVVGPQLTCLCGCKDRPSADSASSEYARVVCRPESRDTFAMSDAGSSSMIPTPLQIVRCSGEHRARESEIWSTNYPVKVLTKMTKCSAQWNFTQCSREFRQRARKCTRNGLVGVHRFCLYLFCATARCPTHDLASETNVCHLKSISVFPSFLVLLSPLFMPVEEKAPLRGSCHWHLVPDQLHHTLNASDSDVQCDPCWAHPKNHVLSLLERKENVVGLLCCRSVCKHKPCLRRAEHQSDKTLGKNQFWHFTCYRKATSYDTAAMWHCSDSMRRFCPLSWDAGWETDDKWSRRHCALRGQLASVESVPTSEGVRDRNPCSMHSPDLHMSQDTQPPLTPKAGLGTTEVECQTPARSTSPNSCSTGPALWEFFRKSAVLQGKTPWRTGKKVAKIQVLLFLP